MRIVPALIIAACCAAAEPAVGAKHVITPTGTDPAKAASVRFWVSRDGGAAWSMAHEARITDGSLPTFTFAGPGDGTWWFVTTATYRDGSNEPGPKAGERPARSTAAILDTTGPVVRDLQAVLAELSATTATVAVAWRCEDANLDMAEISAGAGRSLASTTVRPAAADGYLRLVLPRSATTAAFEVRMVVSDRAGNATNATPVNVLVPVALDPAAALDQAAAHLPELSEVAPVSGVTLGVAPEDTPAQPSGEAPVAAQTAQPSATTAPVAALARPQAKASAVPAHTIILPQNTRFLAGAAAEDLLTDARGLAKIGDVDGSLERYLRLLDSVQARTAAEEALVLLREAGDSAAVAALAAQLAPELRSEAVRVEQGRALLAMGRAAEAIAAVGRVPAHSPHARIATLIIADACQEQGRQAQATRLYEHLAAGEDDIATQARQRLGK